MKRKKKTNIVLEAKIINVVAAALTTVAGIMLLVLKEPVAYQKWMFGALFLVIGISKLIGYFSNDLYRLAFQFGLSMGIFASVIGMLILISPEKMSTAIPVVLGAYVILDGALKIQTAWDAKKFGMSKWVILLISSVCVCLLGIGAEIGLNEEKLFDPQLLLAVALMALGGMNAFFTAYTVRVRAKKKNITDKYDLSLDKND